MAIRKLPALLINQIAAGEVIDRPASVVKELVENSIDAGARQIQINIEEGGRVLIRVSDDGLGISREDLPLAVAPHATSKLREADDLAAISTMGFRGEALASIASVSRMRIVTRPRSGATGESNDPSAGAEDDAGWMIEAEGDRVDEPQPTAARPGTTIEVRDLFFNTPARFRFMKAASTEFGHINETVQRLAMTHPQIGFQLTHGSRQVLDLAATMDLRQRCVDLLGRDLDEALLTFESEDLPLPGAPGTPVSLWGLAGLPSIARATAKFQYLAVNGRIIRDRQISHAMREAYRGLLPADRQPVLVIFIETDPRAVDVNVHPTKAEVRFREGGRLHSLVLNAIRRRLFEADLVPQAKVGAPAAPPPWALSRESENEQGTLGYSSPEHQQGAADQAQDGVAGREQAIATSAGEPSPASNQSPAHVQGENLRAFVNYFKSMAPSQRGMVYQDLKREMEGDQTTLSADGQTHGEASRIQPRSINILQVHKSYVVTQDEEGIVIVDQHALHERVMFEQLRQRILAEGKSLESQHLLMPATFECDARRQGLLEEIGPLLERLGMEVNAMGPRTAAVQAFPTFLFDRHVEPVEFVSELLDHIEDGSIQAQGDTLEEAALHKVLDMMACKAAVKAGDQLTETELEELLAKRKEIERSSNCPHGRPTTLRLTIKELEKQFGRS